MAPLTPMTEKAALAKLEKAYAALTATKGVRADPCTTYRMIKPALSAVLLFVGAVPIWGKYAAKVITATMAAADSACG